jgi:hypothetical protein
MKHRHLVVSFASAAALLGLACGSAPSDREIAAQVDQELANSPVLGETQIGVSSREGVVTLVGVVTSEEQANQAERLAWSVEGVDGVESRLEVSAPEAAAPPGGQDDSMPQVPPVGSPPVDLDAEPR